MPYPTAALPPRPSLSLLSDRAKSLRRAHTRGDGDAIQRILSYHPAHAGADTAGVAAADLSLRDAQLVVAREHGFENWAELKRHVAALLHSAAERTPTTYLRATVPFFGVSDMRAALAHYRDRLELDMTRSWAPDGEIRWCWLERGQASLMLGQHDTEGPNARSFEGRRGEAAVFVLVTMRDALLPQLVAAPADIVDDDGYILRLAPGALEQGGASAAFVPVLDVSNLARSVAFYRDVLGFDETDDSHGDGMSLLRRDGVAIALRQESAPPERRGQGITVFYMCHDAVALYRELAARGGAVSEPVVSNRLWETEINDPDGWGLAFESPTDQAEGTRLSQVDPAAQSTTESTEPTVGDRP